MNVQSTMDLDHVDRYATIPMGPLSAAVSLDILYQELTAMVIVWCIAFIALNSKPTYNLFFCSNLLHVTYRIQ